MCRVSRLQCLLANGEQQRRERQRGEKRSGVAALCGLSGRSPQRLLLLLRRSVPVSVPPGLQFTACTAEGRGAEKRSRRRKPATNLPARLARGSEARGTTSCPAEMTRGLLPPKISLRSPRVRGARATSPPPARRRAVPPPGPTAGARGACALQHEARARGLPVSQAGASGSQIAFPPGEPPRDRGTLGARAQRCRRESLPRGQSVAGGSEGPLSGRGGCGTGRPPVER